MVASATSVPLPGQSAWVAEVSPLELAARDSFQFIWRTLRRLGVRPECAVDDAAQRVFEIAARKRTLIRAGSERAFLFKTAVLVAAEERRKMRRDREITDEAALRDVADAAPLPDRALEQQRLRQLLDVALDSLDEELRVVFVLYELERITSPEIATLLDLPVGTVASRLRRGREAFATAARRLRLQLQTHGRDP